MLRPLILFLTLCTGFTGLAYEIAWQKYLAILLGAHSEATASVLGLFLGGLSLGYALFGAVTRALVERGRRTGRPAPLLMFYGAIEASIGLYCLLFPLLFPLVRSASVALPTGSGALGFAVDVALAGVLILPGATLMGATIPVLTQALARNLADATRVHALIYGWNTVGAFVGALATGFFLVEWLGLDGVLRAMGVVNVVVGGALIWLGRRRTELAVLDPGDAPPLRAGVFAVYGSAAVLVGFAMMVLQTIVIRMGALAFGASEYTFSMVVAVFVLCIALGSFGVSRRAHIPQRSLTVALWCLALLFAGLYLVLQTAPYWAHVLRVLFRDFDAAFYPYYALAFVSVLLLLAPAVALAGAILPLLFHALRHEVGDLGSQAGRLYSVNTFGSLLGALVGGYLLLIWLDLDQVYRVAVGALVLAATVVSLHQFPGLGRASAAILFVAGISFIAALPSWRAEYLSAGVFRVRQPAPWTFAGPSALIARRSGHISFYDDDPNTSVTILDEDSQELNRSILVNGKSDGNSAGDATTTTLLALVPALFAERPENTFVIGFGTGVTAGTLTQLEEVRSVTVAEISSGVIKAAPLFDFANYGVSTHPKVQILHSDAYRALLKGGHYYDVIVSEPSNPWVTGIEQLYSREFLTEARGRLTPGGVYGQWFHSYELNDQSIVLALKTFVSVFDHVALWATQGNADLMLLGFQDPRSALDLARLERRLQRADFSAVASKIGIQDLAALVSHEVLPLDVLNTVDLPGPTHSLYHPLLSFEAGRGFFVGAKGTLPFTGYGRAAQVGAANSLLARHLAGLDVRQREATRAEVATRLCAKQLPGCGVLAAAWANESGPSDAYRALAAELSEREGPRFLPGLRTLLGGGGDGDDSRIRPVAAMSMTSLFMEQYAHSTPFHPTALLKFWQRCGVIAAGIERCRPGLHAAQELVRGERPPAPADWLTPEPASNAEAHHAAAPQEDDPAAPGL